MQSTHKKNLLELANEKLKALPNYQGEFLFSDIEVDSDGYVTALFSDITDDQFFILQDYVESVIDQLNEDRKL
ncbi:hypothetical protein [Acinetobacter baumannii]|uniref:hypothetical protein n=1 Tax=Acinetobacter baumannii TaxID=470 RepID=UPI003A849977